MHLLVWVPYFSLMYVCMYSCMLRKCLWILHKVWILHGWRDFFHSNSTISAPIWVWSFGILLVNPLATLGCFGCSLSPYLFSRQRETERVSTEFLWELVSLLGLWSKCLVNREKKYKTENKKGPAKVAKVILKTILDFLFSILKWKLPSLKCLQQQKFNWKLSCGVLLWWTSWWLYYLCAKTLPRSFHRTFRGVYVCVLAALPLFTV